MGWSPGLARWDAMGWPARLARRNAMGWSPRLARRRRAMGQSCMGLGTRLGLGIELGMAVGGRRCRRIGVGCGQRILLSAKAGVDRQALCLATFLGLLAS